MDQVAFERGMRAARRDIRAGKCRFFAGTRGRWGDLFTRLMRERFGVAVVHIHCFTTDAKSSYEQGYNQTITSHIDAVFGPGSYERTWQEIQDFRQECYRQYLAARCADGETA